MKTLLALLLLAPLLEDYQCQESDGCPAQIAEDGELVTVDFRKGDIVSTDDGWIVHPDDGWKKIRSNQGEIETLVVIHVFRPGVGWITIIQWVRVPPPAVLLL